MQCFYNIPEVGTGVGSVVDSKVGFVVGTEVGSIVEVDCEVGFVVDSEVGSEIVGDSVGIWVEINVFEVEALVTVSDGTTACVEV